MRRPFVALVLLGFGTAAFAECPSTEPDIIAAIEPGVAAFAEMEAGAFIEARGAVRELIACPAAALSPDAVASIHALEALGAFLERNLEGTVSSFRGALAADPDYAPSSDIALEGSPLHTQFAAAQAAGGDEVALLFPPTGAVVYIDGTEAPSPSRATNRATYVQLVAADGRAAWSAYLAAGAANPAFDGVDLSAPAEPGPGTLEEPVELADLPDSGSDEAVKPDPLPTEPPKTPGEGSSAVPILAAGTALSAGATIVSLLGSNRAASRFEDPTEPDPAAWAARSNQWWLGMQVAGVATVGLGAATVGVSMKK